MPTVGTAGRLQALHHPVTFFDRGFKLLSGVGQGIHERLAQWGKLPLPQLDAGCMTGNILMLYVCWLLPDDPQGLPTGCWLLATK